MRLIRPIFSRQCLRFLTGAQIIRQPACRNRFDYVLAASWDAHPRAHARVRSATRVFDEPMEEVRASDHFGLLVELGVGLDG